MMMALMNVNWHRDVLLDHVRFAATSTFRTARRQYHIVPILLLFAFAVALNDGVRGATSTTFGRFARFSDVFHRSVTMLRR